MAAKHASDSVTAGSSPLWNAVLVALAVAAACGLLVSSGRLSWPPRELLSGARILAGCLAAIGPLVLLRRHAEAGLGDLLWLSGGLALWVFNLASLIAGQWNPRAWATPLPPQSFGLVLLVILIAGWRTLGTGKTWTWTNITGWILGTFWIAQGLLGLLLRR
jgi:hypothetical protein